MTAPESQLASRVLMIRPARFASNPLTAESNVFQGKTTASPAEQQAAALRQFDALVAALEGYGIDVVVVADTSEPHTPDAVFPNNWISFHADGRVVLYPMEASNRRAERRSDIIDTLRDVHDLYVNDIVDLSGHEQRGHFLEGTGSMVLDRVNRVAYACTSSRTQLDALGDFAQRMDYEVVAFEAVDKRGVAIYHTNVLMNVGEKIAVICDAAILREDQRAAVLGRLADSGHEILSLNVEQLDAFAGNMLELRTPAGGRLIAMSQRARDSLDAAQFDILQDNGAVLSVAIDTIEDASGGSVRCMLAEVHLPKQG